MQIEEIIKVLETYKNKMYRYALSIVGDTFVAEDVVQEVIIKVWKKREQFEQIDNKEAWVITMVRNLSIDKLRRKKNKQSNDINDYFHISDNAPAPDVQMEQKDALKKVSQIMAELPDMQREIITLRDIEGYTYREIAEIMDMKTDQVKVYLFRARKVLREKLLPLRKLL